VEIAERVGIIQALVSDYELDKLRLNADMVVRFAAALEIFTDKLLKPNGTKAPLRRKPSLRMLRRLEKIESLPAYQLSTLLSVMRQGFFVELLDHYVEGFVPLATLIDDYYEYKDKSHTFVGERKHRRFQLGSRIRVRLDCVDRETALLTLSVV
jgi:transcriptional regulator with XRE-family HTH domain